MPTRIFFSYILLEALTFYLFAHWLGVGWALLILIGCFFGGLFLAAAQMRSIAVILLRSGANPGRAAGDMGLVGFGALLVAVPGILTSILGLLLIFPPTRAIARRTLAKRVRVSMENFGVRSFERAAAYRPKANFGSFRSSDNASASGGSSAGQLTEDQRLNEEIRRWSEQLSPADFDTAADSKEEDSKADDAKSKDTKAEDTKSDDEGSSK